MSVTVTPEAESDAFREVMTAARGQPGRARLAHQSMGRPVRPEERVLAEAMMGLYAKGIEGPEALARGLTDLAITAPLSGRTDWDAALIEAELKALNAAFDAAYADTGIGA